MPDPAIFRHDFDRTVGPFSLAPGLHQRYVALHRRRMAHDQAVDLLNRFGVQPPTASAVLVFVPTGPLEFRYREWLRFKGQNLVVQALVGDLDRDSAIVARHVLLSLLAVGTGGPPGMTVIGCRPVQASRPS